MLPSWLTSSRRHNKTQPPSPSLFRNRSLSTFQTRSLLRRRFYHARSPLRCSIYPTRFPNAIVPSLNPNSVTVDTMRNGAASSKAMELFGERMINRDFRPGGFAEYQVKDLGMGVDDESKVVVLPGASLAKQLFSSMVANGDGN